MEYPFSGRREVEIEGQILAIDSIAIHPDWMDMGPHDFALLRLVEPQGEVPLYSGSDELGMIATLVGHGLQGDGLTGPTGEDGRRRGATNEVSGVDARHIIFTFEEGEEGTDLEGTPAGGDSRRPAFAVAEGELVVLGISSMGGDGRRNGPAT
jgi:hypothetical protein